MLSSENQASYLKLGTSGVHSTMDTASFHTEGVEHVWIVTGPAGCGKSTVAQHLAHELSLPYLEGDDVRLSLSHQAPHS